ncbi:MAG: right-handed parallel beta-helix repeat-containing protein, partial [Planctomycetota bacterium]
DPDWEKIESGYYEPSLPHWGDITDAKGNYAFLTYPEHHGFKIEATGYKTKRATLYSGHFTLNKKDVEIFDFELEPVDSKKTSKFIKTLSNGVTVELISVCKARDNQKCWAPNGSLFSKAPYYKSGAWAGSEAFEFAFRVKNLDEEQSATSWKIDGKYATGSGNREHPTDEERKEIADLWVIDAKIIEGVQKCDISFGVAADPWQTQAKCVGIQGMVTAKDQHPYTFSQAYVHNNMVCVTVSDDMVKLAKRLIAIDNNDNTHLSELVRTGAIKGLRQSTFGFKNLKLEDIKEFQFQTQPYEWTDFKNVSLKPGYKTDVQVEEKGTLTTEGTEVTEKDEFKTTLSNGVTVGLIGVCEHPSEGKQWWRPEGSLFEPDFHTEKSSFVSTGSEDKEYELVARTEGGQDFTLRWGQIKGCGGSSTLDVLDHSNKKLDLLHGLKANVDNTLKKTSLSVGIATGVWTTQAEHNGRGTSSFGISGQGINFSEALEKKEGVQVIVSDDFVDFNHRIIAVDIHGKEHTTHNHQWGSGGKVRQTTALFRDLKLDDIKEFQFQTRPYEWVTFKNVSLKPGYKTNVQVEETGFFTLKSLPVPDGASERVKTALEKIDTSMAYIHNAEKNELPSLARYFNTINESCDDLQGKNEPSPPAPRDWGTLDSEKVFNVLAQLSRIENTAEGCRDLARGNHRELFESHWKTLIEQYNQLCISLGNSALVIQAADLGASAARRVELSYDDGRSDGRKSIAGSGHGVIFDAPGDGYVLKTIRIFGSRYGQERPPNEDFHIYVCDENFEIIKDLPFPYGRFTKGDPKWVTLRIEPVEVPSTFVLCAGFNPERTKGVYVHFDSNASGNSLTGLPGSELQPFNEGEWMIRATLEKTAQSKTSIELVAPITVETKNLQGLISDAKAGDTVIVPPGTYTEPITIDKSLTLKGQSQSASIIEVTADIPAIMIDTKGKGRVTLEDVTIKWQLATSEKTQYPYAVGVKDTKAEIKNCLFYPLGNPQRSPVAVNALGFSNLTISGCRFEGFEYVISYREGTQGKVEACLIRDCGHQGVMSYADSTLRVERNVITGSQYHAVRTTGGTIFVKDNLLISNANRGIYLGNKSGKGTISNNVIMKNGTGIDGFASSNFKIENNIIGDNSYAGIGMRNTTSLSIRNNIFMRNQRGVVLFEPDGTSKNKIYTNTYWKNENDAENVTKIPDSLDVNPGFTNPENGDFSLKDSPVKEKKQGLTNPEIFKQLWKKWKGLEGSSETPESISNEAVTEEAEQTYIVKFVPIGLFRPRTAKELLDAFSDNVKFRVATHHFRTNIERGKLRGYILTDSEAEQKALKIIMDRSDNLKFVSGKAAKEDELAEHYAMGQPGLDDKQQRRKRGDYSSVLIREGVGFEDVVLGLPTCTLEFVMSRLGPEGKLTR